MISISSSEMRDWERAAEESGISSLVLMENAGRGAATFIWNHFPKCPLVLIVCGKGNNAGDGFVIARYLHGPNYRVDILLLADSEELKGAAKINFEKMKGLGILVRRAIAEEELKSYDLIVDALFGIGLTRNVEGVILETIQKINESGKPVVSVDIPSGLHADTGKVLGKAVRAQHTLTFGAVKDGLLKEEGPFYSGAVTVLDIGWPSLS